MTELTFEVLVLDGTPRVSDQRLPSGESSVSSPLSITLISGQHDPVLVDAPYTFGQVERVRNWILDSGKTFAARVHYSCTRRPLAGSGPTASCFP